MKTTVTTTAQGGTMNTIETQEIIDIINLLGNTVEACERPESLEQARQHALQALGRMRAWTGYPQVDPIPPRLLDWRLLVQRVLCGIAGARDLAEVALYVAEYRAELDGGGK